MESLEGVGQNLSPLPGWANATAPLYATPICGSILQAVPATSSGSDVLPITFTLPTSWSSTTAWTSDLSGEIWTCGIPGIYSMTISQLLLVQNIADIVNPVVNMSMTLTDVATPELNVIVATILTVPVTTDAIEIAANVSNIINAQVGTTMRFTLQSPSGGISIVSGGIAPPYVTAFAYNLIAQGVYGNITLAAP